LRNPGDRFRPAPDARPGAPPPAGRGSKVPFDPRRGHQPISTGVLGGAFIVSLYWAYAGFRSFVLAQGGPPVPDLYGWLPEFLRFSNVNRDYFDIAAIIALAFQLMASWELCRGRARIAILFVAGSAVFAAARCPAAVWRLGRVEVTSMEIVFALTAAGLAAVAAAAGWSAARQEGPSRAPPARVPWRRALQSGFARFVALFALFTAALFVYQFQPYFAGTPRGSKTYFENWRITVTGLWCLFALVGLPYAVLSVRLRPRAMDFLDPYHRAHGAPWAIFQSAALQDFFLFLTLVFYGVYVWATMAFGLRFSNLTHRGIVTRGPYAWVRHPAYLSKNLAWWTENLPFFASPLEPLSLLGWNAIYFLRAITEERHLRFDPDYREYCRHVRWRFFPGVC
jgi:protein-S-isoprenylcysteine O-methyltransferase Ste14